MKKTKRLTKISRKTSRRFLSITLIRLLPCLLAGLLIVLLTTMLAACGKQDVLDPRNPVTVTLWHPYVQQMKNSIELLIEEFNETEGKDKGIYVQTAYIADSPDISEKLIEAVSGDPGAPELPDIAIIYPRIGTTLAGMDMLTDFSVYFTPEELASFVPAFLEEGKLGSDTLYILPFAKSTEVLFLNTTVYARFSADTGVSLDQLRTFEGVLDAAAKYYEWSGGKSFLHIVDLFNCAMTGYRQIGETFITEESINLAASAFPKIWDLYYPRAVQGGVAIYDSYADFLMATGEIICGINTSASVSYFSETVTFADNTKEDLNLTILPYPIVEGGEKTVLQRGAGLSVIKSDPQREYAACLFIKWLTEPAQNLRFSAQTGYMPATVAAFEEFLTLDASLVSNPNVMKLFTTIELMQREYSFYYPPVFDGFEDIQKNYNQSLRKASENARMEYLSLLDTFDPTTAYEFVSEGIMERFIDAW